MSKLWYPTARAVPALTNTDPRPQDFTWPTSLDAIVMHRISGTIESATSRFRKPRESGCGASAHMSVGRAGLVVGWVPGSRTARHTSDPSSNQRSFSIAHEHYIIDGRWTEWSQVQLQTSAEVVTWLWRISGKELPLVPHNEIEETACPDDLPVEEIRRRAVVLVDQPSPDADDIVLQKAYNSVLRPFWIFGLKLFTGQYADGRRVLVCERAILERVPGRHGSRAVTVRTCGREMAEELLRRGELTRLGRTWS